MNRFIFPGVSEEDDDDLIIASMEQEGILGAWKNLKNDPLFKEHDRIMLWRTRDGKEKWVIQELTGVPGDEGLLLLKIDWEIQDHPVVKRVLWAMEKMRRLTLDSPTKELKLPPLHPNRN